MRWIMTAAAMALAGACLFSTSASAQHAAATPTSVQTGDFNGTWGFQSEDYGNDDYGAAMSGVAIITPGSSSNRYNIKLLTQEIISQREDGQSHLLVAHENCNGENTNGQLTVTCTMAQPLDNYTPDTFVVQIVDGDHLGGVLTGASGASVNFNRVH